MNEKKQTDSPAPKTESPERRRLADLERSAAAGKISPAHAQELRRLREESALAAAAAEDPDAARPGEVFVRECPECGKLKPTTDPSGAAVCRRCASKPAGEKKPAEGEPEGDAPKLDGEDVDRLGEQEPLRG